MEEGKDAEIRGVHRIALLRSLESQLVPGTVKFNARVQDITYDWQTSKQDGPVVRLESGEEFSAAIIVGADGDHSSIAKWLETSVVNYAGYTAYRFISE